MRMIDLTHVQGRMQSLLYLFKFHAQMNGKRPLACADRDLVNKRSAGRQRGVLFFLRCSSCNKRIFELGRPLRITAALVAAG